MRVSKGIITAYDAANHKAHVLLVGSMTRVALHVPVADHIGPDAVAANKACGVLFFGEGDAGVVVCTFDGTPFDPLKDVDFDAKGDLLVGSGSDLYGRLAVGSDGQVLTADSGQTLGAKWASPAASVPSHTQVGTGTDQDLSTGTVQYSTLSRSISVPSGKTYRGIAVGVVQFECTSFSTNVDRNFRIRNVTAGATIGRTFTSECGPSQAQIKITVTGAGVFTITTTSTIRIEVWKSSSSNTEKARDGLLSIVYWDAT